MGGGSILDLAMEVVKQFGFQNLLNGLHNSHISKMADMAKDAVSGSDLPDGIKDQLGDLVDQWKQNNSHGCVPCECQEMCNELYDRMNTGNCGGSEEMENSVVQTALDQLCKSTDDQGKETSNGKGNWLVVLASALGKQAGEHLKAMVDLGKEMGGMDSKENPEEFAQMQAEFQAESQMFKMFQEAISTMIKSIGEGLSSVARKQ
jgi:hypothetical protein